MIDAIQPHLAVPMASASRRLRRHRCGKDCHRIRKKSTLVYFCLPLSTFIYPCLLLSTLFTFPTSFSSSGSAAMTDVCTSGGSAAMTEFGHRAALPLAVRKGSAFPGLATPPLSGGCAAVASFRPMTRRALQAPTGRSRSTDRLLKD